MDDTRNTGCLQMRVIRMPSSTSSCANYLGVQQNISTTEKQNSVVKLNDQVLQKLREARERKIYEMLKYETIAKMSAANVNTFLKEERLKPSCLPKKVNSEEMILKEHDKTVNNAALILQKNVCETFTLAIKS